MPPTSTSDAFSLAPATAATEPLADLEATAGEPTIERALGAVRELLGMDIAFATEFVDTQAMLRVVDGDTASFFLAPGAGLPQEQTYCHHILAGNLPSIITDVRAEPLAAQMPVTEIARVGAYASVPLRFSDGTFYGTLCAASHSAKPDLGYRELQFLHVFARIVADQVEREQLTATARELEIQAAAATTLVAAVEARDAYTAEHSQAVVEFAIGVARKLGLSEAAAGDVQHVALLHDIGKLSIPDAILLKPGKLTPEEWDVMRGHPIASERLILDVPGLAHLAPAIRAEHERWDGTGYPDGLTGKAIPVASRITLVCDAYHAMTSDRPYRRALPASVARAEIESGLAAQFCPEAGQALLDVLDAS
jgi:HD-GYP domain-containing protein (c-di-GMP phosphodiesterase class II)